MVSRVAEEFHCLPDMAIRALENDPDRLIPAILTLRAFARAKETYDNSKSKRDLPQTRMIEVLQEIEFEAMQELLK